jgi:TP901 family phage tail tape measure protein
MSAVKNPKGFSSAITLFRQETAALNDYAMQAVRAKSATQTFTEALIKQDIGMAKAIRQRHMFNDVLREQYALQKMAAVQYTKNAAGQISADIIVPRGVSEDINKLTSSWKYNVKQAMSARKEMAMYGKDTEAGTLATQKYTAALDILKMRIGLTNQYLDSVAHKMINWGKNTQWAGRQLTVGLSVPLAAFAALAGKAAYDVNKQLTRIVKVYDFTTTGAKQNAEAQQLQADSMSNGIEVTKKYGAALSDTLDVEAQLAAAGKKGNELLRATAEVQRASILGEMDKQDTIKATIALQSVLGHNSAQLADDFNYMNAVENATNLSMQDFVTAIPRALGPLSQLGVNLQDMGVLLAAMKSRGIEAAQGANALKSGLNRVLNPAKSVREALMGFNIDIDKIVKDSGGNFMQILLSLSDQMKNLDNLSRQKIIGKLFGTYQFTRVNAVLQGLEDIHDKTTQVGRAYLVSAKGAQYWAQISQQEMDKIQQSMSGKFKKAVERVKAEFAKLGGPFLQFATMVINTVTGIISAFNKLPHGVKVAAIAFGLIAAAAGPLIMLAGLVGNLVGQGLNMFHVLLSMGDGFKAMTAQERAAELLGKQHSYVWKNQATSAQALAGTIANLAESFQKLAYAERMGLGVDAANIGMAGVMPVGATKVGGMIAPNLNVLTNKNGQTIYRKQDGTQASKAQIQAYREAEHAATAVAEETAATSKDWKVIANRAASFASVASLGVMAMDNGTHKVLNDIVNITFAASLLGPTIVKGLAKAGVAAKIKSAFSWLRALPIPKSLGTIGTKITSLGPKAQAVLGFLKGWGPAIGVAAGIVGFFWLKMRQAAAEARRKQEEINTSAKGWSDVLDFVYQDYKKIAQVQMGKTENSIDILAGQMAKARPAFAEYLQNLKNARQETEVFNAAILEGVKAVEHGATPTQAEEIVKITFAVAGYHGDKLNELIQKAMLNINFSNNASVIQNATTQFGNLWTQIAKGSTPDMKTAAEGLGKEFFNTLLSPGVTPQQKKDMFEALAKSLQESEKTFMSRLGPGFAGLSPTTAIELVGKSGAKGSAATLSKLKEFQAAELALTQTIAKQRGIVGDNLKKYKELKDVMSLLDIPTMSLANAQKTYNAQVSGAIARHRPMDQAIQLNLLNYYRLQAGLKKATSLEQGFGAAVDSGTNKLNKNSKAAGAAAITADQYVSMLKNSFSGAQDAAFGAADSIWSMATQAQEDALQKQTDNQDKAFDRQERAAEHHFNQLKRGISREYNTRINAINKEINKEQNAEERRQKIFEAEQTRLQRLAEQENSSIDFNVAVNSGNLDEAAKIFNTMRATADQNAIADAQASDQDASQRRVSEMQREVKHLEKLRDARLKELDREEAAEKRALERRKARFDEEAAAKAKSLQQELDMRKMYLDLELQAIRANVPQNKREYDKQIQQIEAAYQHYGVRLQGYGNAWGGYVGKALDANVKEAANGLRDEINWTNIANRIANKFAKGAFGLTINQFAKWITTGKLPKGGLHPQTGKELTGTALLAASHGRHSGGPVGNGAANLAGRSPSSGLYRDELLVRAQHGEYMISKQAHQALGTSFFDHLNAMGRHSGGPIGMAGLSMSLLSGMMTGAVRGQIQSAGNAAMGVTGPGVSNTMFGSGIPKVGSYASISDDMLRNAAIIVAVGRAMGATKKDRVTALDVALVESGLHNLPFGDRDSLGLFQQRPSQGWGTPSQVMNPRYAAHAFYASLMRYPQRSYWPIGKAAQIVQRSAYPDIYYGTVPKAQSIYNQVLPSLAVGADIKYDNTIANLHKKETVLTAPLSQSLKTGIKNLEKHGADGDTLIFDFRGATIREEVDIERAVESALAKHKGKIGPKRRIGEKD